MGIGAGISALGSLGAGLFTSNAANEAAQTQAAAAAQALAFQNKVYDTTREDLAPYREAGSSATSQLTSQLPQLSSQFTPDEATLSATPGYQFDLSQGLKSIQNSAAARGLGVSGAALKGATTFATGLADNTLQTQFNIDQTNKTNAYNKLTGVAGLGESAAAQGGQLGQQAATNTSNTLLSSAQGQSASELAAGTAFNPLLKSLGGSYTASNLNVNNLTGTGAGSLSGLSNYYAMNKLTGGLYGSGN